MSVPEKIGAFFDLDGTLLVPPSLEWRFLVWLITRDEISGANMGRWLAHCAKTILRDRRAAIEANKLYLAGLRTLLAADWMDSSATIFPPVFTAGIAQLSWHHSQGHRVFLITGTLAPLARAVASRLPFPLEICATELVERDGHWTGQLAANHMSHETKARILRSLAARDGLDLNQSYAYGNDTPDLPMLESVGNPVAVNPSWRLARAARRRGWRICNWNGLHAARHAAATTLLTSQTQFVNRSRKGAASAVPRNARPSGVSTPEGGRVDGALFVK